MLTLVYILLIVTFLYMFSIIRLLFALPKKQTEECYDFTVNISVLIAARNEERCIERCLNTILKQDYPAHLIEIIVIDDHSEDNTLKLVNKVLKESNRKYQVHPLKNTEKIGKKSAIELGVQHSNGELIVCIDADSYAFSNNWLSTFAHYYKNKGAEFIAGPIAFEEGKGFLFQFQQMEIIGLNLISAGTIGLKLPIMCSGANMAFSKKIFIENNGYEGNRQIASGDDVFLLNKIALQDPEKIKYMYSKNALVYTGAVNSIKDFIQQRIRWAGKFRQNNNKFNLYLGVLTFLSGLCFLLSLFLIFKFPVYRVYFIIIIFAKCFIDILLLFLGARFLNTKNSIKGFLWALFINPVYVCFTALVALLVEPSWKGRKV